MKRLPTRRLSVKPALGTSMPTLVDGHNDDDQCEQHCRRCDPETSHDATTTSDASKIPRLGANDNRTTNTLKTGHVTSFLRTVALSEVCEAPASGGVAGAISLTNAGSEGLQHPGP